MQTSLDIYRYRALCGMLSMIPKPEIKLSCNVTHRECQQKHIKD